MKLTVLSITFGILLCTVLPIHLPFSNLQAQDTPKLLPKIELAETPILITTNNEVRSTRVQTLDISSVSGQLKYITVDISEPKYLLGLEARIGNTVVGSYEFNGIFSVDLNTPTKPTQIPIQFDAEITTKALESSKDLTIWTSPSELAAPDKKISIALRSLTTSEKKFVLSGEPVEYRFGILLRDNGWDGIAAYRIPGIVRSNNGTLIAVYDVRRNNAADLPADVDVGCSRSFDNGKTWEPMQIAIDIKGEDEKLEGVGDPAILVDKKTGRIWIAALWAHNGKSLWQSEPGLNLGTSGQLILTYSDDDGTSWSEPRNITKEIAPNQDWRLLFQGPGSGICTRDGKLVFPAQIFDENKGFSATIFWSDDHGNSWNLGAPAKNNTCEAQVVELNNGSLMLNMRNFNVKEYTRSVVTTTDLGQTWTSHITSGKTLPCPICQASIIRVASKLDGDNVDLLAFMNPNSSKGRVNMTLKLSEDEGLTWTRSLTLYRLGCFGYSSIVKLDANTLGVLYETSGGLIYQTIDIRDVR